MVHRVGEKLVDFVFLYTPHPYDMNPNAQLGLGLLLLATYAKKLGASVRVINAQSASVDHAIKMVPHCTYLMMYGCLIDTPIIERIAYMVKNVGYVCVGGPIAYEQTLVGIPGVDFVLDGYGEDFIKFLVCPERDGTLPHAAKLNHNINYYPFPDRSLIDGGIGSNIFKRTSSLCIISTTLLTSRGCKYKCAFCSSGHDSFFEEYNLDRIEKELEHCLSLGIRNIRISDDNLVSDMERVAKICLLFREAKITWRGSVRSFPNDRGLYCMMRDAGCEELSFGIESGDPDVLSLLNKGATLKQNTRAIKNAKKAGIFTRALMMMGTPGETKDTLHDNASWIKRADPDMVSLKMFVPYPGTDIYHNPEKYICKIHLPLAEVNNSAYRPDRSEPKANIDSKEMFQDELTVQFGIMKDWLEHEGKQNNG